jgi:hypothetical protein
MRKERVSRLYYLTDAKYLSKNIGIIIDIVDRYVYVPDRFLTDVATNS